MKTKVCSMCKVEKSIVEFGKKTSSKDGLNYYCKKCNNKTSKEYYEKRDVRQKALTIFQYINKRCNNTRYQEDRPKYKSVENKLNKEEFAEWYTDNYFDGCEVDRIDDNKDYSMDNIQLLSKKEHNHKRKLERDGFVKDGLKKCNRCGEIKSETKEYFSTHKKQISQYNPQGFRGICKECLNKQRKELYQKSKGVQDG
jgi:hypothetical protein